MLTNYFVCTLGQAATIHEQPKSYSTVSELVDHQAQYHPYLPAVGFPIPHPNQDEWAHEVLTFGDVKRGTDVFAKRLLHTSGALGGNAQTIALLCHSSPEFLFTWLALMRLGHSVLLIAPQCQAAAIVHLCKSCEVSVLFHDISHAERAHQTEDLAKEEEINNFKSQLIPLHDGDNVFEIIQEPTELSLDLPESDETAIAYLHHTSGTSSGLPKPIPQSHRAAIGVLPHLPTIPVAASFTTTPLYHGGIADLFRCWTSNALIWLFPKMVPITAKNICRCLDVAQSYSETPGLPEVRYFSSVPYILQMMEADERGLKLLKNMEIVGVGGAALPAEVGDRLVKSGVNLISRFGSAECGFLLSSYRAFDSDKDWQYLRNYNPPQLLDFEQRDDGLAELVIKPGWPHMAKQNRSDGSFATADLFAPHPNYENAWLYHSRADSQLTLITGKKFDPASLEDAIATSPLLDDALIFGNSQPFPGVLLLRSEKASGISDEELLDAIKPIVEKMNRESQDHARIPHDMLIPMPHQTQPLEKSSKGTIIRRAAESRFEDAIKRAYDSQESDQSVDVKDEDLPQHLTGLIKSITSQSDNLTEDMDLFSYGVDSIACMQLRTRLRRLIPNCKEALPMSVVEDCGTIGRLTNYVLRKRHGETDASEEDEEQSMLKLVKEYGSFEQSTAQDSSDGDSIEKRTKDVVVLTGATGALGAHILKLLQKSENVGTIYCLVRGSDEQAAKERVSKALEQRGLLDSSSQQRLGEKVKVVQAQLSDERLGLSEELYDYLAKEATSIIHVAWTVNFRLKLRSFVKDNIAGVRNLLDLALKTPRSHPPRFAYCSSTAAVMNGELDQAGCFPERILSDPASASPLGYSRSKWVAERVCEEAHVRTSLHGRVAVVRVGQLAGDSRSGIWNTKEAWPMMLSTARLIGCLPDLGDEPLDWLPVDIAAQAFLETTQASSVSSDRMPVYHVLNPHQKPTWHDMLQWLKRKEDFEIVSPQDWVSRLENCKNQEHSAMKLLGLWKASYSSEQQESKQRPHFSMVETKKGVPVLREVEPLDEAYVGRVWDWVQANVH